MAIDYKTETNRKYAAKNANLLQDLPSYINEFYLSEVGSDKELTLFAYLTDIRIFLEYEKAILKLESLKDITQDTLLKLTPMDFDEYKNYLLDDAGDTNVSKVTTKRYLSSISSLYNFWVRHGYIQTNPVKAIKRPATDKSRIIKLESEEAKALLQGIKDNKVYLKTVTEGDEEVRYLSPITPEIRLKREKLVLRNYAIVQVLLGTGIRVSELVGLDMDDIQLKKRVIRVCRKGGAIERVYFDESTERALREYIDGTGDFDVFVKKYGNLAYEVRTIIRSNLNSPKIRELIAAKYEDNTALLDDVDEMSLCIARSGGRQSLVKADNPTKAIFLSNRGSRMSVRMVETMVKEMAETHLVDCEDKEKISPHKLRATCATRILMQTDNIALAQRQLGHVSSNTTSKYYAQIEEERQKKEISELSSTDW